MRCLRSLLRSIDLHAEEGITLVMALMILVVFSVTTATAVTMADSSTGTASTSNAVQEAYALAETGINNGISAIENVPANDPQNPNLLPSSQATANVTTQSTGSVAWWGSYNASTETWTVYAYSTVTAPVGGGAAVHRLLSRTVSFVANLNGNWDRIYQDDASQCLTVPQGVNIPSNITAHGNLCLNGATITGSTSKVIVGGNAILTPVANTGTSVGPTLPATGAGWTNSQNITANDNVAATLAISANSDGAALKASNFGFTIPTGSTISGITVTVERWASSNSPSCCIKTLHVYLMKNGVAGGTDHASATYWPTTGPGNNPGPNATVTFGSTSDLWGQTWTAADVDASNFGVQITPHNYSASSVTASVDYVSVTVNYTPAGWANDASIGVSGSPVASLSIGGNCNYNSQGAHTPCTSADNVFATSQTNSAPAMNKPTADFSYYYNNAAPGPKHGCDVKTGTPPTFDNNSAYDNSLSNQNLTPASSYTCIAKDSSGNVIGQLSWNVTTQVLTISGVVFIDGEADFGNHDYVVHYQGRGVIYAPGGSHIDSQVCAGGSGSTSCVTTGMSNWDPSQNLLVMIVGDKEAAGHNDCKIDETDSAFQGVYWSKNTCDISDGAEMSGPIIATDLSIGCCHTAGPPEFFPWPQLGAILPGVNAGAASYTFSLGQQSG